jgi:hypothetical protein
MAELTKLQRELISRGTMAVLSLALLYGGYRCFRAGYDWHQQFKEQSTHSTYRGRRTGSPALLPYLAGGVLLLGGAVFGLMAVTRAETFARIMGPPDLSMPDDD